jgi:hypothetical protein
MVKYHFITFATESHKKWAEDLCKSAIKYGRFDTTHIYNLKDLDKFFEYKNQDILRKPRGAGYWIWKSYFIYKKLLEIEEGDILCYCDSQYLFQKDIRELEREWLKNYNDIGIPHSKPSSNITYDKNFTKFDAFTIMNLPPGSKKDKFKNSPQAWGGFTLYRRSFISLRFVSELLTYVQDERVVTDLPSVFGEEDPEFKENRHDQSVLSLLAKKWGIQFNKIEKSFLINLRDP